MKKAFWVASMAIIFLSTLITLFTFDYPLVNNIVFISSILAIAFMAYVIFFEEKTSVIIRVISALFGLSGIAGVMFKITSLQSNIVAIILSCLLFSVIMTIATSVFRKTFSRE